MSALYSNKNVSNHMERTGAKGDHEVLVEKGKKKEKNSRLGIYSSHKGSVMLAMEQVRKILSIKRNASIVFVQLNFAGVVTAAVFCM